MATVEDFMAITGISSEEEAILLPSWKKRTPVAFSSGSGFIPSNTSEEVLQSLYRAPLEIMTNGPFDEAKEVAAIADKWLLVNIQNEEEFACHVLNRDFWRTEEVRDLVTCSFTFWQQLNISPQGKRFIERYRVKTFPFVAVLDPHTGALLWKREGRDKVDPHSLAVRCSLLPGFSVKDILSSHTTPSSSSSSSSSGASEKMIQLRVRLPAGGSLQTQLAVDRPVKQLLTFVATHIESLGLTGNTVIVLRYL
eukprot:gene1221-1337_t